MFHIISLKNSCSPIPTTAFNYYWKILLPSQQKPINLQKLEPIELLRKIEDADVDATEFSKSLGFDVEPIQEIGDIVLYRNSNIHRLDKKYYNKTAMLQEIDNYITTIKNMPSDAELYEKREYIQTFLTQLRRVVP